MIENRNAGKQTAIALERQELSRMYLAHPDLESVVINIIIIIIIKQALVRLLPD